MAKYFWPTLFQYLQNVKIEMLGKYFNIGEDTSNFVQYIANRNITIYTRVQS